MIRDFMTVTELAYASTHRTRRCTEPAPRIQRHYTASIMLPLHWKQIAFAVL